MGDNFDHIGWRLTGELFELSQNAAGFAVRTIGADIEKSGPPNTEEEFRLGSRLVELGTVMQARAAKRQSEADQPTISSSEDVRSALSKISSDLPSAHLRELGELICQLASSLTLIKQHHTSPELEYAVSLIRAAIEQVCTASNNLIEAQTQLDQVVTLMSPQ